MGELKMPSTHNHGNCELCDWIEKEFENRGYAFQDSQQKLIAENARLREALEETHKLFVELRRTIDKDHWFASDLDRVGVLAQSALRASEAGEGK